MKQVAVFLALRSFRAKFFRHGLCLALLLFLSGRLSAEISLGQARHAAGTCDGAVPVIANGTAGPFELRVVGDNGYDELFGEFTDTLLVENLCPGNYDFLIANRFLCEVVLSTTIYTCPTLISTVTQPSCGQFNGRIQLSLSGGDVPNDGLENYIFQWADGPATPNRRFVRPGEYCVTVTNETSGCVLSECFEMIDETPSVFTLRVDEVTNPSFPDREDGRISVYIEPPGNYQYQWSTGAEGPVLGGLNPGTYEVTATDGVCEQVRSFTLESCYVYGDPVPGGEDYQTVKNFEDFEVRIVGGLVMPGAETVEARVQLKGENDTEFGDYIPLGYHIEWWQNGIFSEGPSVQTFDVSQITWSGNSKFVQVRVSDGCTEATDDHLLYRCGTESIAAGDFFIRQELSERSCDGFSDGSIYVEIPNPNNESITVSVDGVDYSSLLQPGDPAVLIIDGVEAGTFQFEVNIGNCENSFSYQLPTEPNEKAFNRVENEETCVYDETCHGVDLGEYRYAAKFAWSNTNAPEIGKCKTPILCNDIERGEKKFRQKTMFVWAYKEMLNKAENSNVFTSDYITYLENELGNIPDCAKIDVCPANLEKVSRVWGITRYLGVKEYHGSVPLINGCVAGICGRKASQICSSEFPWGNEIDEEAYVNCQPIRASIDKLLRAKESFSAEFEGFLFTDLGGKLEEYESLGWENAYLCAHIVYCPTDFSIRSNNLDEIRNQCGIDVYDPLSGQVLSACSRYNISRGDNLYPAIVCPSGVRLITKDEETEISNLIGETCRRRGGIDCPKPAIVVNPQMDKFMPYTGNLEAFVNIGRIISDSLINPKPIYRDFNGQQMIEDFIHQDLVVQKDTFFDSDLFIEDWDIQQKIYTQTSDPGQNYQLLYQDSLREWSRLLEGSDTLLLSHLSKTDSAIFLGGRFQGALTVEGASVAFSASPGGFLLKFSPDGELIGDHFVHGLAPGSRLHFSENRQGELVIFGQYETPDILINGATHNLQANPNGIFALLVDRNDQLQLLTYADVSAGQLEPAGVAFSRDGQLISLAYSGAGDLNQPGEPAFRLPYSNSLAVMTLDRTGQRQWMTTYDGQVLDAEHFAMDYGRAGSLFLALTFTDTLKASAEALKLISAGKSDIALLKYDRLFNLEWSQTFGTEDEENVSQILCDSTAIFFGGEFSGPARERLLGNYNFINLTDTVQRAYISYVFDEKPAPQARYREGGLNLESATPVAETFRWKVYPNPFSTTVNVELFGEEGRYLEVNNIFGQRLHRREIRTPQRLELELGVHGPGVYFIKVLDESGRILGVEKVVKR